MADTRRNFLLRFAAGALAAASGGRRSLAGETTPDLQVPDPNPRMMALYGPPPSFQPLTRPKCDDGQKDPCPATGDKPEPNGPDDGQKRDGHKPVGKTP